MKNTRFYVNFTQAYILLSITGVLTAFGIGAYKQAKLTGRRWLDCFCSDVNKAFNAFKVRR